MGDTGSLAIGGMLGTIAICCKQEVLLIIVGFVFVMGWAESKVINRFWIISIISAMVGLMTLKLR